jgi:hypothetical protein
MKTKPKIIIFYCDTDLIHTSFIAAGLKALEKDNLIKIKYKISSGCAKGRNGLLFSQFIEIPEEKRKIVFDLHDHDNYFFPDYFNNPEVEYYKANYNYEIITEYKRKINPFLPYFPIDYSSVHWKQVIGFFIVTYGKNKSRGLSFFKNVFLTIKSTIFRLRRLSKRGRIEDYFSNEYIPSGIAFTPGCCSENNEFEVKVNKDRYELLKLLQWVFKDNFIGGFLVNRISLQKFSDVLYVGQKTHLDYLNTIKKTKINIYTSGINDCISWRLGEVLATNNFVVGPQLKYQFLNDIVLCNYNEVDDNKPTKYIEKCNALINAGLNSSKLPGIALNPKNSLQKIIFSI